MLPTLADGALIWLDRRWYRNHTPVPGEVVVFRHRRTNYVKRVYRGPGETLLCVVDWEGSIYPVRKANAEILRGRLLVMERYRKPPFQLCRLKVPDDCVFVLGDNAHQSVDSRTFGFIPIRALLGRARLPIDSTRGAKCELWFPPMRESATAPSRAKLPPVSH